MTCPFHAILPSKSSFLQALSFQADEILGSRPEWEEDVLALRWRGDGCRYRISPSPRWRIEPMGGNRGGSRNFRGDGLLLPAEVEEALRYCHDFPEAAQPGAAAALRAGIGDPEIAVLCRNWLWENDARSVAALRTFSESCPGEALAKIFRWRFFEGHLPLASCLRVRDFDQLLDAHPQLAWLVATTAFDRGSLDALPPRELRSQFRFGLLELLRMLGLPRQPSFLQLLRRIHIGALDDLLLENLRAAGPGLKLLLALEAPLFAEDIELLATYPPAHPDLVRAIHAQLLNDHVHPKPEAEETFTGQAAVFAYCEAALQGSPADLATLARIRSIRRLLPFSQSISPNRDSMGGWDGNPRLPLPVPGANSAEVSLLGTPEEIVTASFNFKNCARTYIPDAVAGKTAFLIVRANGASGMLQLNHDAGRGWRAHELLAPCNRKPARAVQRAAETWLQQNAIPAGELGLAPWGEP